MDAQDVVSWCIPLIKKNWFPFSLGILGMIFFVYGLMGIFSNNKTSSDNVVFEADSSASANTTPIEVKTIRLT